MRWEVLVSISCKNLFSPVPFFWTSKRFWGLCCKTERYEAPVPFRAYVLLAARFSASASATYCCSLGYVVPLRMHKIYFFEKLLCRNKLGSIYLAAVLLYTSAASASVRNVMYPCLLFGCCPI